MRVLAILIVAASFLLGSLLFAASAGAGTALALRSSDGDYIGQGQSITYSESSGTFTATRNFDGGVSVSYTGASESWSLGFAAPGGADLVPALYEKATRFSFQEPDEPGLSVSGAGRGCNELEGRFRVHQIVYGAGDAVDAFAADFVQYCDGSPVPLVGGIRVNADDVYSAIVDADLDQAGDIIDNCLDLQNPDQLDSDGDGLGNECDPCLDATFIAFDSQEGDYIGQGEHHQFNLLNSLVSVERNIDAGITFSIENDDDHWRLDFVAPGGADLAVGAYEGATRYPFQDSSEPGLDATGAGRGCNNSTGRFDVHEVEYDEDGRVMVFSADFEQHCDASEGPLLGAVRWRAEFRTSQKDSDGDGWPSSLDNRPDTPNPTQAVSDGRVCVLTADQQKCVNDLNKRGAALLKVQGRANLACLKNASNGKTDRLGSPATATDCLTNDVGAKLARGAAKLAGREAKLCALDPQPAFAMTSTEVIAAAASSEGSGLMGDAFGDLTSAVAEKASDPTGARCQQDGVKRMNAVVDALFKATLKHQKVVLLAKDSQPPGSAAQLGEALLAHVDAAGSAKVDKKVAALLKGVTSRCVGVDVLGAFPGCAAAEPGALASCLEGVARCRFCRALAAFDDMPLECDTFDDGSANLSCP
jgi:hypothetical protein